MEKLSEGLRHGWKEVLYNLACATALQGDLEAAKRHLLAARECGVLPAKAHIESDADLTSLREESWFREFLQSLDDKGPPQASAVA